MSKKAPFLAILLATSLFVAVSSAEALEITVDHQGTMRFYNDYVLGESTDVARQKRIPQRVVLSSYDKELSAQAIDGTTDIELKDGSSKRSKDGKTRFRSVEKVDSDNLKVRFPSRVRDGDATDLSENDRSEYMERLKEKRQERLKEMSELRNRKGEDDDQSLELKSRNVRSDINGAKFTLDPSTNEVLLTTPSGNQHILKHLPDQALERMQEVGLVSAASLVEDGDLETEVTEDGIKYKAKVKAKRRLFGLFNREVDAEVVLDDETGEVTEETIPSDGTWGRFLDAVSF